MTTYTVILINLSSTTDYKVGWSESKSRANHMALHGWNITFEEKFLRLEHKVTWGGTLGVESGERNYTYHIPYSSILYIESCEEKEK